MAYHCPGCGHFLLKMKRDIQAIRDSQMKQWADSAYEGMPPDLDESEHWYCVNEHCRFGNLPKESTLIFYVHHPYKGAQSKPGDSWSISWIE